MSQPFFNFLKMISGTYSAFERFAVSAFFSLLSRFIGGQLDLVLVFRRLVNIAALCAVAALTCALLFWSVKALSVSGILFELAGFARVLVGDEWDDILEKFVDEEKYPYGPPSYIMREYYADNDPEVVGEEDNLGNHLYWRRGIALVLVGTGLQLFAAIIT